MSTITINFVEPDGHTTHKVDAKIGSSILDVAHEHGFGLEGACEGSMACSTCHVIVKPEDFKKLPKASEEEEDMLDLTYGLRPTSRLGCQITLSKELNGLTVHLPAETRNMLL